MVKAVNRVFFSSIFASCACFCEVREPGSRDCAVACKRLWLLMFSDVGGISG